METTLDPVIQSKLLDFRRRWRRLVLLRGLGYTVLALVGGLLLLALVDWQWPLEPETRGMCSVGLLIFTGTKVRGDFVHDGMPEPLSMRCLVDFRVCVGWGLLAASRFTS